jgi:hypothetical protein
MQKSHLLVLSLRTAELLDEIQRTNLGHGVSNLQISKVLGPLI